MSTGGRVTPGHWFLLAILLAPPLLAVGVRFGAVILGYVAGWMALLSLIAFFGYFSDKRKAQQQKWRESENSLHLAELAGGWPGAFLAQRKFRHKTSKLGYQVVFWAIVALYELVAIDSLLGWPIVGAVFGK